MMEQDAAPAGGAKRKPRARAATGSARGHKTPRQELADGELPARLRLDGVAAHKGLHRRANWTLRCRAESAAVAGRRRCGAPRGARAFPTRRVRHDRIPAASLGAPLPSCFEGQEKPRPERSEDEGLPGADQTIRAMTHGC